MCVRYPNTKPLPPDVGAQCDPRGAEYDGYWYERTNVRKVPLSQCRGGARPDRGTRHRCPHRGGSWLGALAKLLLFAAAVVGGVYWWTEGRMQSRYATQLTSALRLEDHATYHGVRELVHVASQRVRGWIHMAWAYAERAFTSNRFVREYVPYDRPDAASYHMLASDEDAEVRASSHQILRGYESDDLP